MAVEETIRQLSGPARGNKIPNLETLLQEETVESNVVQILLDVENVPATITDYRNRERHLEELKKVLRYDGPSKSLRTQTVAFRYLIGSLYVNFEKFWGPTVRIIIEILNDSRYKDQILDILLKHLKETNDIIYDEVDIYTLCSIEDRPDFILHRNFIFQILAKFPNFIQSNNVFFMDEFFRFVQKELLVSPFIERYTKHDLTCAIDSVEGHQDDDDLGEAQELPSNNSSFKNTKKKSRISESLLKKRKSRETFITAAKIIQTINDHSKIHRSEELKSLLLDLICCRDSSVQKASFNCLLIFERESLGPYVDKLLRIMNDKKVRTEITSLSLDDENEPMMDEHRGKVIPILMRVLFGKMIGKIGKKSIGKDKADLRKTLVMRFISSCSTEEILFFFTLLFEPIIGYIDIPQKDLQSELSKRLDIQNYVPPNKLQAMLGSLTAFMESVAHLKEGSLSHVLKLINIIIFHTVYPLETKSVAERISAKTIESLKTIRRECMSVLKKFFETFEYYDFKQEELDFIFDMIIWPSTSGFVDKNHATVTPLMKLIETFASHKVYHNLLIKRDKNNRDEYLLKHVINVYADSKTSRPVLKFIATMIADILSPERGLQEDAEDEIEELPEEVRNMPLVEDKDAITPEYDKKLYKDLKDIPFNREIMICFIPKIFDKLKKNCQEFITKKDVDYRIEKDELHVLSILSGFLKDSEQSCLGARLLLSTLSHQKKATLILSTLRTAQSLLRQVEKIDDPLIVQYVADILYFQRNIEQRRELCNLIDVLSGIDSNLIVPAKVINLMNAMSEEFVESPDLVKWNEGFHIAFQYIDGLNMEEMNRPEVIRDSLVLLLHQTGYIISTVDRYEFSIRENSSIFYEKLSRKLNLINREENGALINQLVDQILLEKLVKKGFRETNEVIKHTFIAIARHLAMNCHEKNAILNDFHRFCSSNDDLDFWQNMRHIQLHNRSKALARLVASDTINEVAPKTLSSYFMPLAAGFLFSKSYKSVSSLSENSIKLIGIICKHLNWVTYESTLSYYLGLLTKANATYQKTNIRLITEILSNFNFDLRECEEAMQHEDENNKLESRMKKRRGPNQDDSEFEAIITDVPSGKRLNPSTARMVYFAVTKKILPRLNSLLHEMTKTEFESDKNMREYLPEKEEIKRISIAYAIVQLLNLLPGRYVLFRDQLPGLLLKLTSFLKSKSEQVRKAARHILIKVMSFVGPAYLSDMLRVLRQNLEKGFQIHVMNYTIHSVLDKIPIHYGDLDHSAHELIELSYQEIFGKHSEDKEIAQILAKTPEAKKTKSYDTLMILASHISDLKLDHLMRATKDCLKTCTTPKDVNKLSQCLQRIFVGLSKNDKFPLDKLFAFIKESIQDSIPNLKVRKDLDEDGASKAKLSLREDRFLITKDKARGQISSKINEKSNYHMIVENSLRLLLLVFEKNKVIIKENKTHINSLDGFIKLLSICLKSSSPRCVMRSLKCIHFITLTKADLPTFKTKCNSIVKKIFILLNLYNGVGMVHGDNFEMIQMCFKTLTLLLLRCDHVKLTDDQIRALISYIEQDFHDTNRQATAFSTLLSLLEKGYDSPELAAIMTKVADLLVTSEDDGVRTLSTKIWKIYLLKYAHDKDTLQAHLARFMRQIDYEHIDGREAVIRMLTIVISEFPEHLLRNYFELLFQLLAQRVVNEESKEIRASLGKLLGLLMKRLPDQQAFLLNKFIIPWASNDNNFIRLLGIKLSSILVESCPEAIKGKEKINKTLDSIANALEFKEENAQARQKSMSGKKDDELSDEILVEVDEDPETVAPVKIISVVDRLNYHALRLLQRLLNKDIVKHTEARYISNLKRIWHSITTNKLKHRHLPVVITSCQLYLTFIKQTNLSLAIDVDEPKIENYLEWNAKRIVRTLCDKYIDLLDRADESNELLSLVAESMMLLGQMLANCKSTLEMEAEYKKSFGKEGVVEHLLNLDNLPDDGFLHDHLPYKISDAKKKLNLMWLSIKVVMQARKEVAMFRSSKFYRRNFVLQWTAAISQVLGAKRIQPYVFLYIMTPIRELTDKNKAKMNDTSPQSSTLLMSEDLLKFLKNLLTLDTFNRVYSKVQLHYTRKRVERKKTEAIMKVRDQARGVKRKLKQSKKKVAQKKAKIIESKRVVNGNVKKMRT